jgi:hypothetical protein
VKLFLVFQHTKCNPYAREERRQKKRQELATSAADKIHLSTMIASYLFASKAPHPYARSLPAAENQKQNFRW